MAVKSASADHPAARLLSRAHSPPSAATLFTERIIKRPLAIRPSSPPVDARKKRQDARTAKAASKARRKTQKPRPLSAKQKRALCIYELSKEEKKYVIYEGLHRMWCGYIREVLGLSPAASSKRTAFVTPQGAGPLLASADFHGALVEIVRSRCVSRVGVRGIVVKDTKFTFEIITNENEVKIVPKEHTIFKFEVPLQYEQLDNLDDEEAQVEDVERKNLVFELHGSQFESRPVDRATKKFKMHLSRDL